MSEVLFLSYARDINAADGLQSLLTKSGLQGAIRGGDSIAVKLHMGELGNIRYIRPILVRGVIDFLKGMGAKPFLFDTVVNYPGSRDTMEKYLDTAARNGFTEATMGAPVVIADDDGELQTVPIAHPVDGCDLKEARIPALLLKSDHVVVLSHVKGHDLTGFGGAIKNLAMGCVSRETKRAQHSVNMPEFREDRECNACGECVEICPTGALVLLNGKPVRATVECTYCGTCVFTCPSRCWAWPRGSKERLQVYMAHAAGAVVAGQQGKFAFVSFIQDITRHCDCTAASGRPVVPDVGIAFSLDPVAVDKAALDLIDQSPVIPGSTEAKPPDILGKIHRTSSLVQLQAAEKLKVGSLEYELVPV